MVPGGPRTEKEQDLVIKGILKQHASLFNHCWLSNIWDMFISHQNLQGVNTVSISLQRHSRFNILASGSGPVGWTYMVALFPLKIIPLLIK